MGIRCEPCHCKVTGEGAGGVLRQRLQHVADGLEALRIDVGAGDHGDRCRTFQFGAFDARADNVDPVQGRGVAGRSGDDFLIVLFFNCLGECHRGGDQQGREQGSAQNGTLGCEGITL